MNSIIRICSAVLLSLSVLSCEKEKAQTEPLLPVTYANLDGLWQLHSWKGNALPDGTWCYVEFKRRERTFVMHQNLDSMFDRVLEGSFEIEEDEYGNYIVGGTYDWGRGDWGTDYYVTNLTAARMTWTSVDSPDDVSVYERVEALPEGIE